MAVAERTSSSRPPARSSLLRRRVAKKDALLGRDLPRVAPPVPARSGLREFRATAAGLGISLMPWQETAARYLTATAPGGRRLFPEVCLAVARQQGKTHLMRPYIVGSLREGKRIVHISQTRELPKAMFRLIAESLDESLLLRRRGKGGRMQTEWPRFGSGSEEILLANGGAYRIAAASRGSARGQTNDIVIIDELREQKSTEVIEAAEPTLTASPDPQIVYLSNAGDESSAVLNDVRARAGADPSLAYLEWSAAPDRMADDHDGWAEANPALGHMPGMLEYLERKYRAYKLSGRLAVFETEHLCRWVATMRERLVDEFAWRQCGAADPLADPRRPFMAVSMAPSGARASAAIAWQLPDGSIALRLAFDVMGDPIRVDDLGRDLRDFAIRSGVLVVGFDPLTDAGLAKWFKKAEPVSGTKFANATDTFTTAVKARRLHWEDAAQVGDDLVWTARKPHEESGSYQAVRANDDRPITAALASIRAVWLASGPSVSGIGVM